MFPDFGAREAACIDDHPYRLAALHLINARDEMIAARAGGPADIALLVAGTIFAQTLKVAALTPLAPPPLFHFHLTAADQIENEVARLREVGEHADSLGQIGNRPALGQTEHGTIAHKEAARRIVAAHSREYGVTVLCRAAAGDIEAERWRHFAQ